MVLSLDTQWYKERDIPDLNLKKIKNKNFKFSPQIFYTHKSEF